MAFVAVVGERAGGREIGGRVASAGRRRNEGSGGEREEAGADRRGEGTKDVGRE